MKPSLRHGLPYGWWKSGDFWAGICFVLTVSMMAMIIAAWFLDWKPWW